MPDDQQKPPSEALRETGVVRVMTSTSVHKHVTAFQTTRLPILQVALDVGLMTEHLRPLLGALAGPGAAPEVRYARLLAYKQGNRGLLRYELAGLPQPEGAVLFGKLFGELRQAERLHETMRALWAIFAGTPGVGVPRPLGCVPELAMFVYVPAEGQFLNEVIGGEGALRAMELAGTWLGALHRGRLPLERHFHMANEVVNLQAWASLVGQRYPEMAEGAERIAAYLRERATTLPFDTASPIHKDFHYGHIVVGDRLAVIDFDEMRLGDPNFDLAHFCANLHLLAYRTSDMPYTFSALQRAFLGAYAAQTGWSSDERFVYFYAYTCLKIAKQLCTLRGLRPRPEGEEQRRQVALMIAQGLGSLPSDGGKKLASRFATQLIERPAPEPRQE
ncbi:MAG TPA: phosphotransferase [Roseiflexaceae bacterium]|nr:phosphotransferase [Roseiflexaceae bacterium]